MIDYESLLNHEIKAVKPSGIRKFFDIANEMEDVISLSIGEPDFSTPWHVRQEAIDTLQQGKTWYSPNRGFFELRQAGLILWKTSAKSFVYIKCRTQLFL